MYFKFEINIKDIPSIFNNKKGKLKLKEAVQPTNYNPIEFELESLPF